MNYAFPKIDLVIIGGIPVNAIIYIKHFAKKNDCRVVFDVVEWNNPSQFKNGPFSIMYIQNEVYIQCMINRHDAIIAISRYLQKHFQRNKRLIYLPVLFDPDEVAPVIKSRRIEYVDKIIVSYAGSPGSAKKDNILEMITGISKLSPEVLSAFEFNFVGISYNDILALINYDNTLIDTVKKCCNFLGRKSRNEVLEILRQSHFTMLLRSSEQRYAKAGFPTKIVESISMGIPPIFNYSSNLEEYFNDFENCVIIQNDSSNAFRDALVRVKSISNEQYQLLSKQAFQTASRFFNYKRYISEFESFLDDSR